MSIYLREIDKASAGRVPDIDPWAKSWEKMEKELPAIRERIEEHFRGLLGVADSINGDEIS